VIVIVILITVVACQMAEMDGFEATRELRRREGSDWHTIVIAMTAGAMAEDQETCRASGMDAYLSRPVMADTLMNMITSWLDPEAERSLISHAEQESPGLLDQRYVTGLREVGTDEFDKLVRLFLKDGETFIDGLRTAQTACDTSAMVKLAHSLKGSASSFGAGTLAWRCGELQARARAADAAEDARMIDSVAAEFALASAALREELAADSDAVNGAHGHQTGA
jgi:two-component system sensor histidine kinase/response regulator